MHPCSNASFAGRIFGVMSLWWSAYMMQCIYGVLNLWCAASLFRCSFGVMSLLWFIYLLQYSFRCIASLVLCICTFGMLFIGIFGVPNRWCAATLVNYILVAIFLWCNVCIFGELHLWWIIFWLQYFFGVMYLRCIASLVLCICTFGMLCIGNFVGASLVWLLLCNASLVHCFLVLGAIYFWCCFFWCYALSAILRRLATAVAHLLYNVIIIIIITRPWPAYGRHGLAGSSGGDQSGRINSSHSIIEELARFARSDWMGLSGGDQSGRINPSQSIIQEFAR